MNPGIPLSIFTSIVLASFLGAVSAHDIGDGIRLLFILLWLGAVFCLILSGVIVAGAIQSQEAIKPGALRFIILSVLAVFCLATGQFIGWIHLPDKVVEVLR